MPCSSQVEQLAPFLRAPCLTNEHQCRRLAQRIDKGLIEVIGIGSKLPRRVVSVLIRRNGGRRIDVFLYRMFKCHQVRQPEVVCWQDAFLDKPPCNPALGHTGSTSNNNEATLLDSAPVEDPL